MSRSTLHSRILYKLANTMPNIRHNDIGQDIMHFLSKCPSLPQETPLLNCTTIFTRKHRQSFNNIGRMTRRTQEALGAFINYLMDAPQYYQIQELPKLVNYLRYLQLYDWDYHDIHEGLILPEIVTYQLYSGLLYLADVLLDSQTLIMNILLSYTKSILDEINNNDSVGYIICFALPSLVGIYRALQLSPYRYTSSQLEFIYEHVQLSSNQATIDIIRTAITQCLETDDQQSPNRQTLITYWEKDEPMTFNRTVYDILVIIRNVLARNMASLLTSNNDDNNNNNNNMDNNNNSNRRSPSTFIPIYPDCCGRKPHLTQDIEYEWTLLLNKAINVDHSTDKRLEEEQDRKGALNEKNLRKLYATSMSYYQDVRMNMDTKESNGNKTKMKTPYMLEIMGTSIQVATLVSIALHLPDDALVGHIADCLFSDSRYVDTWIYVSALDSAVLLAINFPQFNTRITQIICQFLATPSNMFDTETKLDGDKASLRKFAVVRLALCVQKKELSSTQVPQAAISILYSLLNEITHYSQDEGGNISLETTINRRRFHGVSLVDILDEKQRRQVCTNVLSAIIGVAVYLKDESIISQALPMLLLERRSFSLVAATSVLSSLGDLALVASSSVFEDILGVLSMYSREYLQSDNKTMWTDIVTTQTTLAKRIYLRPDLQQIYLTNILSLFLEHGSKIQQLESNGMPATRSSDVPLTTKLGTLLPILEELLKHDDFNPQDGPITESLVSLYRNFWILCVLFGFVNNTMWIRQWHTALMVIAQKSPLLVTESAKDYWEADLENNSILRGHVMEQQVMMGRLRQELINILPSYSSQIKGFSFAQVVLLLGVYHTETRRSQMGNAGYILGYFMNETVGHGALTGCLEGILDSVLMHYTTTLKTKAAEQTLGMDVNKQLVVTLPLLCHRLDKVHTLACQVVDRIVHALPQVFADKSLIILLLELVQLLWLSCAAEFRNEYKPVYQFTSKLAKVTIELVDSFSYRRKLCTQLCDYATRWLSLSMECCPLEINGLLQDYLSQFHDFDDDDTMAVGTTHMGRTIALQIGKTTSKDQISSEFVPQIPGIHLDDSSNFAYGFTSRTYYTGKVAGIDHSSRGQYDNHPSNQADFLTCTLKTLLDDIKAKRQVRNDRIHRLLLCTASFIISQENTHLDMVNYIVQIPVYAFTPESLRSGTNVWNWIMIERPDIEERLMIEVLRMWTWAQRHRRGLFSPILNFTSPFTQKMTYQPSDTTDMDMKHKKAIILFTPHEIWLRFIISHFFSIRHKSRHLVTVSILLLQESFQNAHLMSTHPMSRSARFQLLYLGMQILCSVRLESLAECKIRSLIYDTAFNWFGLPPSCRYGTWKSTALLEKNFMIDLYKLIENDTPKLNHTLSSSTSFNPNSSVSSGLHLICKGKTRDDILRDHQSSKKLLLLLLENEIYSCTVWYNPLNDASSIFGLDVFPRTIEKSLNTDDAWKDMIRFAWMKQPRMAVQLASRFKSPSILVELKRLIANNALDVVDSPEALTILLGDGIQTDVRLDLRYLKYWAPVPAITATNYFLPSYGNQPMILQYAMRSLEHYSVDIVFFYIPQLVQTIRHDDFGYVERYIMKAGQVSQLFAHQIIWNMKANFYLDADKGCEKPDPMKPTLERIIYNLVSSFADEDRQFYEREFKFFGDITAISGYLKEYIKLGQNEKKPMQKKRLDEELEKVKVDVGVYLPSNPDGCVVDISRTSGKPLQSHAKAPFMATFLIEKEKNDQDSTSDSKILATSKKLPLTNDTIETNNNDDNNDNVDDKNVNIGNNSNNNNNNDDDDDASRTTFRIWQGAIFKVGDDCRQDVLVLQLIAVFKKIFLSVGLDLYVYPYRVVATGPGLGVIDVLPQSISRDQLGREKVNSIYDYFVAKYGGPNSVHFQRARMNFVQSLAAYSVISYLLQIKDRHNGNIMLDDKGHLIHIDFGFIFDIAPGGGILESSPFKLTTEMIQVMGGHSEQQPFKQFSELVVKAYLACRPYAEVIIQLVQPMLESGLPCFKGDTIRRMRTRFQTDKSDRVASDFMIQRIKDSFENQRTVLYDYFQKVTNGIPY
ncbi:uncharacterized protein BX664DRAFT_340096 [Halteromyces radiatus]|uniref:uncharacterized protein n=1 Tax=Halteromyces radiatus TaxID=101107 RepID=UPI002220C6B0|nr:uncharacterized protein BX664DRAFT_340096 [Halteromyces radiatus]KAI8081307.1 hypothetical protein BX664DRAFT_340096 [Halteromyces radiatus]